MSVGAPLPDRLEGPDIVTYGDDHHLPQYHLRLPRGYLNDPNGPVEIDGQLHLYFQSRPAVDLAIPVEWGHATSPDLVHWTLHRPAIVPVPGGDDSGGAWSGNTVLLDGTLRAYYSGKVDDSQQQPVVLAESHDGGASFGPPRLVVGNPAVDEAVSMFRDPFVWRRDGGWSMAMGAATGGQVAAIRHYRSSDGIDWQYAGELLSLARDSIDDLDIGEGWECPQILRVDDVEVALVAAWSHSEGPGDVLAIPIAGGGRPSVVDGGHHFYAASVMRESRWGAVLFGWITEGRPAPWTQQAGWSGAISLPRTTWLSAGRLGSAPHPAVETLRSGPAHRGRSATLGAQAEVVLPTAVSGRIRLRFSPAEHLDIVIDAEADTIAIDRSRASSDERADREPCSAAAAFDDSSARPAVRLFLDGSVVEVFTSAGRALTTRVYPTQPPPWQLEGPEQLLVWSLDRVMATG